MTLGLCQFRTEAGAYDRIDRLCITRVCARRVWRAGIESSLTDRKGLVVTAGTVATMDVENMAGRPCQIRVRVGDTV
jgi:hypothetical protein